MNERIRELMNLAGAKYDSKGNMMYPVNFHEVFAELIVQDCMNAIRQEWFHENNTVPDQDARSIAIHVGKKLGIDSALHAVTKHFGVE